jgi:predicted Zn finger-like uncharacterized protein
MGTFPGYRMKVVCDNCRAVYKVPDDKLTKAVNKATCRNCGHRMLIPRPKPNADPEERTLVTAVPPTPVGAPPRAAQGRHRNDDREESTLPGRHPDDVRMETPMMAPRIGDTVPAPEEDFDGPDTRIKTAAEQTTVKPQAAPPRPPSARGPASLPPQRRGSTPPPAQQRSVPPPAAPPSQPSFPAPSQQQYSSAPQPPATRRTPAPPPQRQPRATPAPAAQRSFSATGTPIPAGNVSYGGAIHDPAGDLNWALLGTSMALIGGVLLSILSIFNHALIMWFGLAMTFGGGILSFLVLLTGARGRRPAQTLLSVVLGFLISVTLASLLVGTKWGAEKVIDAYDIRFASGGEAVAVASPVAAPGAPAPAPAPAPDGAVAPVPESEVVIVPNPTPGKAPKPQPGKAPKPQPAAPSPAPASPQPQPVAAQPPPAPAPSGPALVTVPVEVVHTIVSNNIEVKRCFVPLFQSGALPPRVDASFQISPAGKASGVTLAQAQYRGSQLESCLARAIGSLQFPPAQQGTALSYPFILQ